MIPSSQIRSTSPDDENEPSISDIIFYPGDLLMANVSINHMYEHRPAKVGIGIGVIGALFILLTTTLLFMVPFELMTSATRYAYIETWSRPIMTVGQSVTVYGIPLVSGASAYYLTRKNHTPKSVVVGFLIGGLVCVLANALFGVMVTHLFNYGPGIDQSLFGHIDRSVPLGARLAGGALVGILFAITVEERI